MLGINIVNLTRYENHLVDKLLYMSLKESLDSANEKNHSKYQWHNSISWHSKNGKGNCASLLLSPGSLTGEVI